MQCIDNPGEKDHFGMDREQIHEEATAALLKVEAGNTIGLVEQLNGMNHQDRLAVAREMCSVNFASRQADDSLPRVEITSGIDATGQEVLLDIAKSEKR